jgi:hypothetical protein
MTAMDRQFADMPARIAILPRSPKGFPIPFFAEEVNGQRDFRVVSAIKMAHAVKANLCWVCGQQMGVHKAFVIGPMCAINRTISDPPSHTDCAIFSAKNCPFMSRPLASRRASDLPEGATAAAGFGLSRNPGAVGVWVTRSFRTFRPHAGNDGVLFRIGDPEQVFWFANGRAATRDEVLHSIETGLPHLAELAERDGPKGKAYLAASVARLQPLLPQIAATP